MDRFRIQVIKVADYQQATEIRKRRTCARLEPDRPAAVHLDGMEAGVNVQVRFERVRYDVIEQDR